MIDPSRSEKSVDSNPPTLGDKGRVQESELVLLRKIMDTFEDLGVHAWLDQGSLLGAIRDGQFLPLEWDEDVDLGVWKSEIKKVFPEFARRLRTAGARVDFPPGSGTMMIVPQKQLKGRPVNIGAYTRKKEYVEKKSALIRKHINPPKSFLKRTGRVIFPRILRIARKLIHRSLIEYDGKINALGNLQYRIGSSLNQIGLFIRYYSHKRITFQTSRQYFDEFQPFEIYGMRFLIPKHSKEYLRSKYGEDWHIPKKEWVFWEQDGAIKQKNQ